MIIVKDLSVERLAKIFENINLSLLLKYYHLKGRNGSEDHIIKNYSNIIEPSFPLYWKGKLLKKFI